MTVRERLLYHHLHPVKLGMDVVALAATTALLWQQHLLRAAMVGMALPAIGSTIVLFTTSDESWDRLASRWRGSPAVTWTGVAIRVVAAFVCWGGAWYRAVSVCLAALAAAALTFVEWHLPTVRFRLDRLRTTARQGGTWLLRGIEGHRNALAAVLMAVCVADIFMAYVGRHPFREYLTDNSDLLYLPAVFSDVLSKGGHLSDWYLTPAPYFFPDYLTYLLAYLTGSTAYFQIVIFAVLQTVVTLGAVWFLARGVVRSDAFVIAVAIVIALLWLALNVGEPFLIMLASASHFGSFICALLLAGLWARYRRNTTSRRWMVLAMMSLLACAGTLSDNLFIVYAAIPLIVTVGYEWLSTSRPVLHRGGRVLTVTLWVVLTAIVPVLIYRTPIALPSVNVAWSPSTDQAQRPALETRFHLVNGDFRGGRLWTYQIADWSRDNIAALVRDPSVEDTQHIDRQSFTVDGAAGPLVRAVASLPVGIALSSATLLGALFVVGLLGELRRRHEVAGSVLGLVPLAFCAVGSMSYGLIVANPTRYPLSIGLEKTYTNLTDLFTTVFSSTTNHPMYGVLFVTNLALVVWIVYRHLTRQAADRQPGPPGWLAVFGSASIVFTFVALSLITDLPVMPRYLIPALCWPVVMVPLLLQPYAGRALLGGVGLVSLIATLSLSTDAYALVRNNGISVRYYSGELACIDNALQEEALSNGIAQYWDAKYLQQFSRLDLNVGQYLENLDEMRWITSKRYFRDAYDFAVVSENAETTYRISSEALARAGGAPTIIVSCGSRSLYVYGKNRLNLRPARPAD